MGDQAVQECPTGLVRLSGYGRGGLHHLIAALTDRAELAGIRVIKVDERGTSSTCPRCRQRTARPAGRNFARSACGFRGSPRLVRAANLSAFTGTAGEVPTM